MNFVSKNPRWRTKLRLLFILYGKGNDVITASGLPLPVPHVGTVSTPGKVMMSPLPVPPVGT